MGIVYKARDKLLGRLVAVKLLAGGKVTSEEQKLRLIQEASAASLLNHPNIVTVYEVEVTKDGMPYIVMEYVDGQSLRELIAERNWRKFRSIYDCRSNHGRVVGRS
jgi:eukaryotic-like serine/threonine-protein kinase